MCTQHFTKLPYFTSSKVNSVSKAKVLVSLLVSPGPRRLRNLFANSLVEITVGGSSIAGIPSDVERKLNQCAQNGHAHLNSFISYIHDAVNHTNLDLFCNTHI